MNTALSAPNKSSNPFSSRKNAHAELQWHEPEVQETARRLAVNLAPSMNKLFHSATISPGAWLKIVGVGLVVFVGIELKKWLDARRHVGKSGDAVD